MKNAVMVIVLALILVTASVVSEVGIERKVEELQNRVNLVSEAYLAGDAEKAMDELLEFYQQWRKAYPVFSAIVRHEELENVEETYTMLHAYLQMDERSEVFAEANTLLNRVRHIYDSDKLTLGNVF